VTDVTGKAAGPSQAGSPGIFCRSISSDSSPNSGSAPPSLRS